MKCISTPGFFTRCSINPGSPDSPRENLADFLRTFDKRDLNPDRATVERESGPRRHSHSRLHFKKGRGHRKQN